MLAVYITSFAQALEVVVASGLVALGLGAFAAVPFLVQYFVDDRRSPPE